MSHGRDGQDGKENTELKYGKSTNNASFSIK